MLSFLNEIRLLYYNILLSCSIINCLKFFNKFQVFSTNFIKYECLYVCFVKTMLPFLNGSLPHFIPHPGIMLVQRKPGSGRVKSYLGLLKSPLESSCIPITASPFKDYPEKLCYLHIYLYLSVGKC